jgi:hypothetical protein
LSNSEHNGRYEKSNTKQTDSHSKLMEIHMEAAMTSFFNKIQSQQKKDAATFVATNSTNCQ